MATLEEKQELIDILKFTPRTYKISMWGYGGEKVMGIVDRKIYDYFKHRRLDLSDYAWNSEYAEENNIPEDMQPFPSGSWYECDSMTHTSGVSRDAGTLQIEDENGDTVFERPLDDCDGCDGSPELDGGEEYYIGSRQPGEVVFYGSSNEKGTFFEGEIELKQPFNIEKLTLCFDEVDGEDIVNGIKYDGEDIDNWGSSTDGKSSDFGLYLVKDSNTWEKYSNMDDIEYVMTERFPKKINPVREGLYMVKTAGRNSYTYQCKWTGAKWVSGWTEPEDYNDPTREIKIKEWQGLAQDPDASKEENI
jgi:hypothetical protein